VPSLPRRTIEHVVVRGITFIDRLSVLALIENAEANDHKPMN